MTKHEALKLAMDWYGSGNQDPDEFERLILSIVAQPEHEPVAWRYRWSVEDGHWVWNYATYIERQKDDRCEPLYTTPPQRTWVGLTGEEIETSKPTRSNDAVVWELAVEWAEAKLKEKNT